MPELIEITIKMPIIKLTKVGHDTRSDMRLVRCDNGCNQVVHKYPQAFVISDEKSSLGLADHTSAVVLPMLPEGLSLDLIILSSPDP